MLGSALVYAGVVLAFVGLVTSVRPMRWMHIRTRRRAALVLVTGAVLVTAAVALPAPTIRAAQPRTQLDEMVPAWQFGEGHETRVHAEAARVGRAIRALTAREIGLFRLLTWIRNPRLPGSRGRENILAAPADRPILDVALKGGFMVLAEEPQRELGFGTLVVGPRELRRLPPHERARLRREFTPAKFRALDKPGYAKAAMSFRLAAEGGGWPRRVGATG